MSKARRRRWPWLLALLVIAAVAVALLRGRGKEAAPEIDMSRVVPVERRALAIDILETGKIAPREKVEIKSRVAGQVTEVKVDEGQQVKKGQLLLILDPTDYEREAARAEVEVARAKAALDYAQTNLSRIEGGVDGGVIQTSELPSATHEVTSKAIGLRSTQISLGIARAQVLYTRINSPIDGTVIVRGIQPGEVVTPGVQSTFEGRSLLTIADLSVLLVEVQLNQIDAAKVRLGQKATVTVDALPGRSYEATITKIAPASVRPAGRDYDVFPVEAQLTRVDGEVKPGMTADVRVHVDQRPDVVVVPVEAVRRENGKDVVTRVVDGPDGKPRTEPTEVTLGVRNEREVEITKGLSAGDRIFIDPGPATANETKM